MKPPEPLESFYPQLAKVRDAQATLRERFAVRASGILKQMEVGSELAMTPLSLAFWDGGFQD